MDAAALVEHGGADAEPRVRGVGAGADGARRGEQRASRLSQGASLHAACPVTAARDDGDDEPAQRVGAGGRGARDVLVAQRARADARGRVRHQRQAQHGQARRGAR